MRTILITSSAVALLWSGAAFAQDAAPVEPDTSEVDAIVVTAERRTTNLQTTPIAASVLTGADLEKKGVSTVEQLQFSMPSLTVQNSGQGNSFNIRGIGKTENSSSIGVGVITYRDGVAVFPAYFQNEPFYDIQSVEVLRGPQGTFAGQNATGGAVFITQRNPDLAGANGYITGQYGNYNHQRIQGALNVPMSDTMAVRVAANVETRDSFYDVIGTPTTGKPGEYESFSLRGSFLWEPTDAMRVLFKTDYSLVDLGGYPTSPVFSTLPLHTIETNGPYAATDEIIRSVLNLSYEFDNGITLRSITGYQDGTTMVRADSDGTAAASNSFYDKVDQRLWSQEFNLISPDEGRFNWIVGAYYQDDLITFPPGQFVTTGPFPPLPGLVDLTLEGTNPKTTAAAFGQIGFDLTDRLELQVGARYSRSTVENHATSALVGYPISLTQDDEYEESATTGKVALNWTVNDDHFLYAFVAKGHKAGGLNGVNLFSIPPREFEGEDVMDYEIGWKADFMDGRLRTQVGAYYNVYENFQVILGDPATPLITSILNVSGETIIKGIEATAQGRFGDLRLDVGVSLADTELGHFFAADTRRPRTGLCDPETGPASGNCVNVEGNAQTYAPELTVSFGAEYEFRVAGGILTPRIDYSHISETWTTIFANEALGDRLEERDIVNAQLTYETGDWAVQAYATNLTDLEYIASIKTGQRYAGAPRQYGVRLTRSF